MPTTFVALAVATLAVLPGAARVFAYGARVGSYGVGLPDRIFRFLAVSIAFQAVLSGPSYIVYRSIVRTGELARGEVPIWTIEVIAICYVAILYTIGWLVGEGVKKDRFKLRLLARGSPEPRAWDHLFSNHQPNGIIRIKLKSGQYIAGLFGRSPDGSRYSHASGYPEAGDLYLYQAVDVDGVTGEFGRDDKNGLRSNLGAILVRWDEIEFLEIFE